jgi:hypothetical protein
VLPYFVTIVIESLSSERRGRNKADV